MEFKYIPYTMYAEGFVTEEEADLLESYSLEDIEHLKGKKINSNYHNFLTTSSGFNHHDDGVFWERYQNILTPYYVNFVKSITDRANNVEIHYYMNLCQNGDFVSPHFDGYIEEKNNTFMALYCPLDYGDVITTTSYQVSEKFMNTFYDFEKVPMHNLEKIDLIHQRGKFFIMPSNLFHWVCMVNQNIERITVMGAIQIYF